VCVCGGGGIVDIRRCRKRWVEPSSPISSRDDIITLWEHLHTHDKRKREKNRHKKKEKKKMIALQLRIAFDNARWEEAPPVSTLTSSSRVLRYISTSYIYCERSWGGYDYRL
jgi:hypothetical protein